MQRLLIICFPSGNELISFNISNNITAIGHNMISNTDAIDLFKKISEMDISHKSHQTYHACQTRAHKIAQILLNEGISNTQKIWIYSPTINGNIEYNILLPTEPIWGLSDDDYDYNGQLQKDPNEIQPYNFHVAPFITTNDNANIVFDTHLYSAPPELEQWLKDIKPFNPKIGLETKTTSAQQLYLNENPNDLNQKNNLSRFWHNKIQTIIMDINLYTLFPKQVQNPLESEWANKVIENSASYETTVHTNSPKETPEP